jgi:E3 ubiquitin-protein ligase HUWE1
MIKINSRLAPEKRAGLLGRLTHLAASWGGKDNGFGLSKCCSDDPMSTFPESATTLHFEFYTESAADASGAKSAVTKGQTVTVINVEQVTRHLIRILVEIVANIYLIRGWVQTRHLHMPSFR